MQITFSGRLGSGKSTVCAILREEFGYEIYSTGTVQRRVAEEMGITTLELNKLMKSNPELDHKIDDAVTALSRERKGDNIVFDSRMAWHFAEDTFKVYMYVDPTVAGNRVFAADRGEVEKYIDAEDAKRQLLERTFEENGRYKNIYGVDNLAYSNYNLILDSTSATPHEIAQLIIDTSKLYEKTKYEESKIFLSPYVLLPTKHINEIDEETSDIPVIIVKNNCHYVIDGHKRLLEAQKCKASMCPAKIVNLDSAHIVAATTAEIISEYETIANFKYFTLPETL